MAEKILLTFSQYTVSLEAGATCRSTISIHNRSSIVDQFTIQVEGLDDEWYELSASSVKLFPGDQESITLTLHPPRESGSKSGKYPFSIRATSVDDPSETTAELGTLEIRSYQDFALELHPARQDASAEAAYQIIVRNRGNSTETFRVGAKDDESLCEFRFDNDVVRVDPGESESTGLTVRTTKRPVFGAKRQTTFQVVATPDTDADAAKTTVGQAAYRPIIPIWVVTVVLPLVILIAVGLYLLWPVDDPTIDSFTVSPASIGFGDSASVRWLVQNAKSIAIEPEPGNVDREGSIIIAPQRTTVLTLTAKNRKGVTKQAKVELTVIYPLPVIDSFTASPERVKNPKRGVTLSWEVSNAEKVKIQPGIGDQDTVGTITVYPEQTTTFMLVATNPGGDVEKGIEVFLETSTATLNQELSGVEQKMKDFSETGKHLFLDRHQPDQAIEKFRLVRQEYAAFRKKYGSEPRLEELDADADQWIKRITFQSGKESAKNLVGQQMEEKITSAKFFYQMGRFSEAEADFRLSIESYGDFKRQFGSDDDLQKLSTMAQEWIDRMKSETNEGAAFAESKRAMKEHIVLGQGFHDRGQYDQAIWEFTTARSQYEEFQKRFGQNSELGILDNEAVKGIERAKLAKELESR